jgi:hypothetical protein
VLVRTHQITELVPPADALTPDGVASATAVDSAGAAVGTGWQDRSAEASSVFVRRTPT